MPRRKSVKGLRLPSCRYHEVTSKYDHFFIVFVSNIRLTSPNMSYYYDSYHTSYGQRMIRLQGSDLGIDMG